MSSGGGIPTGGRRFLINTCKALSAPSPEDGKSRSEGVGRLELAGSVLIAPLAGRIVRWGLLPSLLDLRLHPAVGTRRALSRGVLKALLTCLGLIRGLVAA